MIAWSGVCQKARAAGIEVREITMCGSLVGYEIGARQVRHNGVGWFDEAQVGEAIRGANLREAA